MISIPFATALANGKQPGGCFFDQATMRGHLMQCLQEQNITESPLKKTRRTAMKIKSVTNMRIVSVECRNFQGPQ